MSRRLTCRCAPSIIWVRDADQTLLVDQETKQSWSLRGVSAVIWDLLAVGYSHQRIVPLLSLIISLPIEEVEQSFTKVLGKWLDEGIVQTSGEAKDGELDRQCGM
jgi:hypothetical protein